jgi:hypothetical protein
LIAGGLVPVGMFGYGLWQQVILKHPFGGNPMSNTGIIIAFGGVVLLFLLLVGLFGSVKLNTLIDEFGVAYRFIPFQIKFRKIAWTEIESCEVVKYDPMRDYGGWGIRVGKKGKAYNISGDKGLQLTLKNGKHFLLGTQKEQTLKDFLTNGIER